MAKGPRGEKRPSDAIGAAIMVGRIATEEIDDLNSKAPNRAKGGKAGGKARAKKLKCLKKRREIAKMAAKSRWGNN